MSEPKDYVSAYKWDHYCQIIYDRMRANIAHMDWELGELYAQNADDMEQLLHYYQKWHYNKELYQMTHKEVLTRKYVIENMLNRGYGVNIDLANSLAPIGSNDLPEVNRKLGETFYRKIDSVQFLVFMPQEHILSYNSAYIISELCNKLGYEVSRHIPSVPPLCPQELNFSLFFELKNSLPGNINSAVFKKMFLALGENSKTIMKGTIGHENFYSPQYLKTAAINNLIHLFGEIYASSPDRLRINLDLLRRIHYLLYRNLDTPYTCSPGEFRIFDFEDRNGVTVEEGKLLRELRVLEGYLSNINWDTFNLYELISGLSEVYHLIIAIHPFSDANGRVGKCFFNYIMMVKGMAPLIFDDEEEVLSLPRYGSSLLDIEAYFKNRINYSINYYIREIRKIESNGNIHREIGNVDFDSGFHFRQSTGMVEINFTAYIIPDYTIREDYIEQCKIVFPDEHSLHNMEIYMGLSHIRSVWEKEICIRTPHMEEIESKKPGIRIFDVTFFSLLEEGDRKHEFLELSVVSPLTGELFNNKNLNYCYRIM